jgi:hypothetical protein
VADPIELVVALGLVDEPRDRPVVRRLCPAGDRAPAIVADRVDRRGPVPPARRGWWAGAWRPGFATWWLEPPPPHRISSGPQ